MLQFREMGAGLRPDIAVAYECIAIVVHFKLDHDPGLHEETEQAGFIVALQIGKLAVDRGKKLIIGHFRHHTDPFFLMQQALSARY